MTGSRNIDELRNTKHLTSNRNDRKISAQFEVQDSFYVRRSIMFIMLHLTGNRNDQNILAQFEVQVSFYVGVVLCL